MPMPGQASGDFTESSSALRILYVGHRNSFSATLTSDGFTQTNPPVVDDVDTVSERLSPTPKYGVLSGSVAFTRPDEGNGYVGGPLADADFDADGALTPLGLFINDAEGNAYENTPGPASGQGPYVSAQGTMGSMLYETMEVTAAGSGAGTELEYHPGDKLYASVNGYLTNVAEEAIDSGQQLGDGEGTVIGIVKVAPDAQHGEVVFDQRI